MSWSHANLSTWRVSSSVITAPARCALALFRASSSVLLHRTYRISWPFTTAITGSWSNVVGLPLERLPALRAALPLTSARDGEGLELTAEAIEAVAGVFGRTMAARMASTFTVADRAAAVLDDAEHHDVVAGLVLPRELAVEPGQGLVEHDRAAFGRRVLDRVER